MLSEEEPIHLMLHRDSHKMMEGPEVLHDEFPLDSRYVLLQKCCIGCSVDNVINIME
jgi:hypothetical protein